MKEKRIKGKGIQKFNPCHHMVTKTILVTIRFDYHHWMEIKKGGI
jgi:hypothetical protein